MHLKVQDLNRKKPGLDSAVTIEVHISVPGCNKTTETTVTLITQQLMKHVHDTKSSSTDMIRDCFCCYTCFLLRIENTLLYIYIFSGCFSANNVNNNYENIQIK